MIEENSVYYCKCGLSLDPEDGDMFKIHIGECDMFQKNALLLKILRREKIQDMDDINLLAVFHEIDLMREVLREEIKLRKRKSNQYDLGHENGDSNGKEITHKLKRVKSNDMPMFDAIKCSLCQQYFDASSAMERIFYLANCCHVFCRECLSKEAKRKIPVEGFLSCSDCKTSIQPEDITAILGKENYENLYQQFLNGGMKMIKCIKCGDAFVLDPGKASDMVHDAKGLPLPPMLRKHYCENRVKCPNPACKEEQCIGCHAFPYHLGYTCEQFQKFKSSKHCRYCNKALEKQYHDLDAFRDICNDQECMQKLAIACPNLLQCGHPCPGHDGEDKCLPCLNSECEFAKKANLNQKGEDYCNICYVEGLSASPCIQIGCGHIFHYECLTKRIESKWHTPRIFFTFAMCPLCNKWMELPRNHRLGKQLWELRQMFEEILRKSLERLKFEGMENDPKLSNPGSPWYKKKEEYAMATFSYFQCHKCKKPYFGGKKNCEAGILAEEQNNKKEFKPEELVCPNCCDIGVGNSKCPQHGTEFISYKCRFCCSVAVWFCGGTTHYCDPCHSGGPHPGKPPHCPGKDRCPLKVNHPPNGKQEFALGCGMCGNMKDEGSKHDF